MRANYSINEDGHLQNVTTFPVDNALPILELPNGFDLKRVPDYVLRNGILELDPLVITKSTEEQILELKQKLAETDYIAAKAVDAMMLSDSLTAMFSVLKGLRTEYAEVIALRKQWREQINQLESLG